MKGVLPRQPMHMSTYTAINDGRIRRKSWVGTPKRKVKGFPTLGEEFSAEEHGREEKY
jgi:hypothetical protein